jgi:hypothetical protein
MHPNIRENALPLHILPTLLLAVVLCKLPTQRGADKHLKHNRARLAATPPIICERRLPRHWRSNLHPSSPAPLTHPDLPLAATPWLSSSG